MGRELKFRGKSINGHWYYGLLSQSKGQRGNPEIGFYISNAGGAPWAYQIIPETVGQFTGLYDKNGKEIYEGDIDNSSGENMVVEYKDGSFGLKALGDKYFDSCIDWHMTNIIGNIY